MRCRIEAKDRVKVQGGVRRGLVGTVTKIRIGTVKKVRARFAMIKWGDRYFEENVTNLEVYVR